MSCNVSPSASSATTNATPSTALSKSSTIWPVPAWPATVIAVRRERVDLGRQAGPPSDEIGYHATSLGEEQHNDAALLQAIRDHWSAIENGAHHRRDVSFGEDASGVSQRGAAQVMAALRNLALGIYELEDAGAMKTLRPTVVGRWNMRRGR